MRFSVRNTESSRVDDTEVNREDRKTRICADYPDGY